MKNLNEMTAAELKKMAKEMKISNWWNLKKEVLIRKIEEKMPKEEEPKAEKKTRGRKGNLIEFDGRAQNLNAWAKELGISSRTLFGRINNLGWSVEKAFTTHGNKK